MANVGSGGGIEGRYRWTRYVEKIRDLTVLRGTAPNDAAHDRGLLAKGDNQMGR